MWCVVVYREVHFRSCRTIPILKQRGVVVVRISCVICKLYRWRSVCRCVEVILFNVFFSSDLLSCILSLLNHYFFLVSFFVLISFFISRCFYLYSYKGRFSFLVLWSGFIEKFFFFFGFRCLYYKQKLATNKIWLINLMNDSYKTYILSLSLSFLASKFYLSIYT